MITKILQKILNIKSKAAAESKRKLQRFLSSTDLAEKMKLIEEDKNLSAVPDTFWFLLSNQPHVQERVAQGLHQFISSLTISQLIKLDRLFRERTSLDWSFDWEQKNPCELLMPNLTDDEKVSILGLSTFHPNGYFREKAI